MNRYRLNIAFLLAGIIACTALATCLFIDGLWAQGCLSAIAAIVCIIVIWHLQSRLITSMSTFVNALEMNDTTTRISIGGDHELRKMTAAMNRISEIYRENMRELQTRKHYYDRVLKIITHEMRNGITPIIAISADMMAKSDRYAGQKLIDASSLINSQAEGIHRFLNAYYTLTHLPEPKRENVGAKDYFLTVKSLFKAELDRRGVNEDVVTYTVPADMTLDIDTSLMNQVLMNMLRNALDALPFEGGKIEIVLTVSDARPYLTIKDNGSGITQEVMENLFQPFYSTKPEGSGVGLTISRQIIRLHGGDLRLQSQPGKGTTAIITL